MAPTHTFQIGSNNSSNNSPPRDFDVNANVTVPKKLLVPASPSSSSSRGTASVSSRRTTVSDEPQNWRRGERPATSDDTLLYRARWRLIVRVAAISYYLQRKQRAIAKEMNRISEGLKKM